MILRLAISPVLKKNTPPLGWVRQPRGLGWQHLRPHTVQLTRSTRAGAQAEWLPSCRVRGALPAFFSVNGHGQSACAHVRLSLNSVFLAVPLTKSAQLGTSTWSDSNRSLAISIMLREYESDSRKSRFALSEYSCSQQVCATCRVAAVSYPGVLTILI